MCTTKTYAHTQHHLNHHRTYCHLNHHHTQCHLNHNFPHQHHCLHHISNSKSSVLHQMKQLRCMEVIDVALKDSTARRFSSNYTLHGIILPCCLASLERSRHYSRSQKFGHHSLAPKELSKGCQTIANNAEKNYKQ